MMSVNQFVSCTNGEFDWNVHADFEVLRDTPMRNIIGEHIVIVGKLSNNDTAIAVNQFCMMINNNYPAEQSYGPSFQCAICGQRCNRAHYVVQRHCERNCIHRDKLYGGHKICQDCVSASSEISCVYKEGISVYYRPRCNILATLTNYSLIQYYVAWVIPPSVHNYPTLPRVLYNERGACKLCGGEDIHNCAQIAREIYIKVNVHKYFILKSMNIFPMDLIILIMQMVAI